MVRGPWEGTPPQTPPPRPPGIPTARSSPFASAAREGAASGRTTSFVVFFVVALNRVNIVTLNAILFLHIRKGGRQTAGQKVFGLPVPRHWGFLFSCRLGNGRAGERSKRTQRPCPLRRALLHLQELWEAFLQGSSEVWGAAGPPTVRALPYFMK